MQIRLIMFLAVAALAVPAFGATVIGAWLQGSQSCPGISALGEMCSYTYTTTDSPILGLGLSATVCMNVDNTADEAGAGEVYLRYQPGGAGPDENFSYRATDSSGADIVLNAAHPCEAMPPGPIWIEGKTDCVTGCYITAIGRSL